MCTCGGGHEWSVDCDIITLWPQLLQRHLLHTPARRNLWRGDGVVTNGLSGMQKKRKFIQFAFQVRTVFRTQWSYLHTEGLHSCRHLFTDSSKPCNPKNLSIQLCAHELQNHSQSTQSSNTRMRSNTFSDHNRLVMTGLTQKGKYGYGITTLLHYVLYIMNSCRIPGWFT